MPSSTPFSRIPSSVDHHRNERSCTRFGCEVRVADSPVSFNGNFNGYFLVTSGAGRALVIGMSCAPSAHVVREGGAGAAHPGRLSCTGASPALANVMLGHASTLRR